MINVVKEDNVIFTDWGRTSLQEMFCLSTDTKPTEGLQTGSVAIEVDTGDGYLFDSVSQTWKKV